MKKQSFITAATLTTSLCLFTNYSTQAKPFSNSIYQYRNSITGYVFDPQRRPVAQIPVELRDEVYQTIARTRTDGSGRYYFSGLSAGRFSVRVLPLGTNLEEQIQEVEIINFVARGSATTENAQKDFYLRFPKGSGENPVNGVVFYQEVPEPARKLYEKGISHIENNKTEVGLQDLQDAIRLFPDYYLALDKSGSEYIKLQKYEDARTAFSKAVVVNPRSFNSWYGLGFANYALKQSDAAVEAAQKAVAISSNSVQALLFLGISLRQAKRYNESEKSLKDAKKLSKGKVPDVHFNLALLYAYNLNRYDDAANELELYLKAKPDGVDTSNVSKLIKYFREKSSSK